MTDTQTRLLRIVRMTVFLAALAGSAVTGFRWAKHDFQASSRVSQTDPFESLPANVG